MGDRRLKELVCTCNGCPSQWEGVLEDGSSFEARYRYGVLTVQVGGYNVYQDGVGGSYDGIMSTDQMLQTAGFILVGEYSERY